MDEANKVPVGGSGMMDLTPDQLTEQINRLDPAIEQTTPEPVVVPEATPQPTVVEPTGSVQPQGTVAPSPVVVPATEPPKADTQDIAPEVKDFLLKKGLNGKSQDELLPQLVKMYTNVEKLASKHGVQPTTPVTPVAPIQPGLPPQIGQLSPEAQQQFLNDLQSDPVGTMRKFNEITVMPAVNERLRSIEQEGRIQKIHNVTVGLSTNPDTRAEFNLPIVQAEIAKIMEQEHPEYQQDVATYLPTAFDTAVGRLYRQGKLNKDAVGAGRSIAIQQQTIQQAATMPGAAKPPTPPAQKSVKDMNPQELEALLKGQMWTQ